MKLVIKLLILIIFIYILFFHIFTIKIINSNNMYPSIKAGQLVIIYKLNKEYKSGDVVYINKYKDNNIFRIIASGGDIVNINEYNELLVNNSIEEEIVFFDTLLPDNNKIVYPYTVLNNRYYVLNDYRTDTYDSRSFGSISSKEIDGLLIASIQIRDF